MANTTTVRVAENSPLFALPLLIDIKSRPKGELVGDVAGDNNDIDGNGDYGNEVINIGDATLVSGAFGSANTQADINADGTINVQDLSILGGRGRGLPSVVVNG